LLSPTDAITLTTPGRGMMSVIESFRQQCAYAYTVRRRMRCTNSLFASLYPSRSLPNLLASCRFKSA
jgi:hypothetical protein